MQKELVLQTSEFIEAACVLVLYFTLKSIQHSGARTRWVQQNIFDVRYIFISDIQDILVNRLNNGGSSICHHFRESLISSLISLDCIDFSFILHDGSQMSRFNSWSRAHIKNGGFVRWIQEEGGQATGLFVKKKTLIIITVFDSHYLKILPYLAAKTFPRKPIHFEPNIFWNLPGTPKYF